MKRISPAIVLTALALWTISFPAHAGLSITLGGNTGVYLLPGEVTGFSDGSGPTPNRYIWSETATNQYGYTEQAYKYKHPFPERTLPNAGFNFGMAYTFEDVVGIFIEMCPTFSILDNEISQSTPDSLPGGPYSMIPNDYSIRTTESNDRLYLKSFQFGVGVSYAVPLKKNARIIVAGSFGSVNYSQNFRIETKSITTDYYQSNGHRVYSETSNPGSFEAFGIRYEASCFKPSVAIEWDLRPPLSARVGLACPVALIEKGFYFTDNNYNDYYSTVYYPSKRFWTGNLVLNAGISFNLGRGGRR